MTSQKQQTSKNKPRRAGPKPCATDLRRKSPHQNRAKVTLSKIISAGEEILGQEGIRKLTMRKIAKTAGVSVGSAYEYFPSKQAIIYRIYEERLATRLKFFDAAFADPEDGESFKDAFTRYLELQQRARFPSRLDLELQNAIEQNEQLAQMTQHFEDELSRRYVDILHYYGSNWPDDQLMQLAKFAHQVDHVHLKLQSSAQPSERRFYGDFTTDFFYFLVRYSGASTHG